jgi:hypothetical protein
MNRSFRIVRSYQNALMLNYGADTGVISSSVTGPTGCSFIGGTGSPTGPCNSCDTYIDLLTGDIYVCITGAWTGPAGSSLRGPTGPTGPTGVSFTSGTGIPTGPCTIGDTYVDINTGDIFICATGGWTGTSDNIRGPTGATGPTGASILSGPEDPVGACRTGDTYINIETGEVFECIDQEWVNTDETIIGPTGPAGEGATGPFLNGSPAYGTMWVVGNEPYPSTVDNNVTFECDNWPKFTGAGPIWYPGTGPSGTGPVGMEVQDARGMRIFQDGVYLLQASLSGSLNITCEWEIGFFVNGGALGLWSSTQTNNSLQNLVLSYNNIQLAQLNANDFIEVYFASEPGFATVKVENFLVTITRIA